MTGMLPDRTVTTTVVGLGMSGLALFHYLREAGVDDVLVVESAKELGGTWRDNTYPGCACDVESTLYSLSFAPNPHWTRAFAGRAEIHEYMIDVAERLGVRAETVFGCRVTGAVWLPEEAVWRISTESGEFRTRFLIDATGPFPEPRIPDLPGLDGFDGRVVHTARWPRDLDLTGKRVAIVGTGASAIQVIPAIQPLVEHLTVLQRTPGWVLPRVDREIPARERARLAAHPEALQRRRRWLYRLREVVGHLMTRRPRALRLAERQSLAMLRRQVPDARMRADLTPDYWIGCKRILLASDYYPALTRENVDLIPWAATAVTGTGVVSADGRVAADLDVIVLATGFHLFDPASAHWIIGSDGLSIADRYGDRPRAYLGSAMHGLPNAFMVPGPNSGAGHSSLLITIEAQANYIAQGIRWAMDHDVASLEINAEVQERFNEQVQRSMSETVWARGGCDSYYRDNSGEVAALWPASLGRFRRLTERFDPGVYDVRPRPPDLRGRPRAGQCGNGFAATHGC